MSARAVVRLTVEVPLADAWGDDWKLGDIRKSAGETAKTLMEAKLGVHRVKILAMQVDTVIVGED